MSAKLDPAASPEDFVAQLKASGRRRAAFYLQSDSGRLEAGCPELSALAGCMNDNSRDFAQHEAVFLEVGTETGALLAAFLHRTARGQGAGGVRHWHYGSVAELLSDGLRLSRGMGRKNALAGLWWGGGKGIVASQKAHSPQDALYRGKLYRDYGRFISQLRGAYITAEDVGTTAADMATIFQTTRYVTCVPESVGGSGNPSQSTARGVVAAMEAAQFFHTNPALSEEEFSRRMGVGATLDAATFDGVTAERSVLRGKRVVMQGTGNVARFMIGQLLQRGVREIVAAEISTQACEMARSEYPDPRLIVKHVAEDDLGVFAEAGDIFAPNALGGILHPETIAQLNPAVVCGAANNQLLDDARDGALLSQRGIVFVPDFVANRMGIVQCANEQYGAWAGDPAIQRHFDPSYAGSVPRVTWRVLQRATELGATPTTAANQLADELSAESHPIWPGRTQQLISSLRADAWDRG